MANNRRVWGLLAGLLGVVLAARLAGAQELLTTAERTDFTETSTFDDVDAFFGQLAAQSDRVRRSELGTSVEGRAIPLVIIADPPVASPEEARRGGRMVALLLGNIHAGEVCGKEALQMLARELALEEDQPLLEHFVVCMVPIYNADGNERMAPDNRPGQVGPDRMGVRPNAMGLDLNRDFVKAEAPETRALLRFFRRWDPEVFIDTHTTNGSHHRYVLTYSGPKHPGGDQPLLTYVRDTMLPRVSETLREEHGHDTFTYGNFAANHTEWTTFPAAPRYGTNYYGLRNRISVLSEAYSYAPFSERVIATLDFCRGVLSDVAAHRDEVGSLLASADESVLTASGSKDPTPVRTSPVSLPAKSVAKGFVEVDVGGESRATEETRDYEVEVIDQFIGVESVDRPWAYILPGGRYEIAAALRRHGITVEEIREDLALDVTVYTFESVNQPDRAWQGHRMATVEVSASEQERQVESGALLVSADQQLGHLVVAMLEPHADDSLLAWNYFDDVLAPGAQYPIVRVASQLPILTTALPALPEDRDPPKKITYEALYESRDRPSLTGNPMRSVRWRDASHYTVQRGRETWLVEAESGRYIELIQESGDDRDAIASAIEGLVGLDARAARQIADRGRYEDRAGGRAIFSYQGDLYAVDLEGTWARRLTSSPGEEELASLSPDGSYAAFVLGHDLYAVEIGTGIERRLTTTGTGRVRNGKNAWVYFEELFGRSWQAYWWSPDSRSIAFFETDSTEVDTFTLVDDATEPHEVELTEYPKPGSPNPHVRVGIVRAAGGEPAFVPLDHYTRGAFVISSVGWWDDSSRIHFTVQDRAQRWLDLCTAPPDGGAMTRLLRDRTEAWIEAPSYFHVLDDGSFLLSSERDGWNHLYRYNADGSLANRVTEGEWEFRGVELLDEEQGVIYFNCTADSPIGLSLYRVRLDGSDLRGLTPGRGTHRTSVSPDGGFLVDSWSHVGQPDRTVLLDGNGEFVRTLDSNPVHAIDDWDLGEVELVSIPASRTDGGEAVTLEGLLVYPPDFDPSRSYPVWFMTYAGPHAPTVRDSWSGGRTGDQMLAQSGFVVFRGDPYSASGKGARSAWVAYERLGEPEMEDIDDMMRWLKAKPFVDGSRIGMSGFSYGGFMTSYAMTHSDHFAAGIAGGSVTSWGDYDTIYTERYMNTPQENPEGYERTSVVAAAGNLHGRLLLVHGWMDDNVHVQNSIKLVKALQDADKDFEMMFYPRFRHGIWSSHYRRLNYDFQMRLIRDEPDVYEESESLGKADEGTRRDRRGARPRGAPTSPPGAGG